MTMTDEHCAQISARDEDGERRGHRFCCYDAGAKGGCDCPQPIDLALVDPTIDVALEAKDGVGPFGIGFVARTTSGDLVEEIRRLRAALPQEDKAGG